MSGSLALNSMRMEKAYRVSGDMTQEVTAYEAGLMRFADPARRGYIGREVLAANMCNPRWKLAPKYPVAGALSYRAGSVRLFRIVRRFRIVEPEGPGEGRGGRK